MHTVFSPAVFSQKEVLQGFLQEQTIRHVTQLYKKLNLVIMGIGIPNTQNSTILRTGYVDKRILQTFTENGAVGDIALRFLISMEIWSPLTNLTAAFQVYRSRS